MRQPIELRRARDFGQIVNDTFTFLKENFKPLFKAILIICGSLVIVSLVTAIFTTFNHYNAVSTETNTYDYSNTLTRYYLNLTITLLFSLVSHLCLYLVTLCYIAIYVNKNSQTPTFAEVWGYFRYYFFRVMGSGVMVTVILVISFSLCLVPGFYLFPILLLILPIMVIENGSFNYAFNKCFALIKSKWWTVCGVIVVMWILMFVSGLLVGVAIRFVETSTRIFSVKSILTFVIVVFSILKSLLIFIYVIPSIAISLCYLSLEEEKEGTGLLSRIERFGLAENAGDQLPAEEY